MSLALFTGACRSGKSALAQHWVERHGTRYLYLATAGRWPGDAEMDARIQAHQASRGPLWQTLELAAASGTGNLCAILGRLSNSLGSEDAILIDCTTLWLAGLLDQHDDAEILAQVDALAALLPTVSMPVALVHNEVGWGLVPETPLGRRFRDLSGLCGQRLAAVCDTVVLAVCGLPVVVKGHFVS